MLAGILAVVIVELVGQVQRERVRALLVTGDALMGCPVVHAVVGLRIAGHIRTGEQAFLFLEVLEEFRHVLGRGIHRSGILTVQLVGAGLDDLVSGGNRLLIIGICIGSLHVGEFLLHGVVGSVDGGTVPILAFGSGPEGGAGLHAQGRVLVGTHFLGLLGRKKVGCLLELIQDPVPGFLLRRTGNVQAEVLTTVIFLIQGMVHDGNATVHAYLEEITVGTQEHALSTEGVLGGFIDDTLLLSGIQGLQELVDGTDGSIVPEG